MISISDLEYCANVLNWYRNHMLYNIQTTEDYILSREWRDKNIEYFENELEKIIDVYGHLTDHIKTLQK